MTIRGLRALTAVLLVGGVAAASVPDPSTTLAALTDAATVSGSARAAVLTVDLQVTGFDGQPLAAPAVGAGERLTTTVSGPLLWSLSVELVPAGGELGCTSAPSSGVTVELEGGSDDLLPCGGPLVVRPGEGPWSGVLVLRDGSTDGEPFDGVLRVRVDQAGGGFHDEVDVPVRLGDAGSDRVGSTEPPVAAGAVDEGAVDEPAGGDGSSASPAEPPAPVPPDTAEGPAATEGGPVALSEPVPPAVEPADPAPITESDGPDDAEPLPGEESATEEAAPDPAG